MPEGMQLWWVNADQVPPNWAASRISAAEQTRATDMLHPEARRVFIAARAVLRHRLSVRLGHEPDIRIRGDGKPELATEGLHFNLAHSGPHILIGISPIGPIGVDTEDTTRPRPQRRMAERYFTEVEQVYTLDPEAEPDLFYRIWCCKEAVLKASGIGIRVPLNQVDVSLALADWDEIEGWQTRTIDAPPGLAAAVAVPQILPIDVHRWHQDLIG